jgi:hypothetical protein
MAIFGVKLADAHKAFMNHIVLALAIQCPIGLLSGNWWMGAAAGAAFFLGREIAQAEYRNIEHNFGGRRANMPWWGGFEPRAWTRKGLLDWLLPSAAVIAVAIFANT